MSKVFYPEARVVVYAVFEGVESVVAFPALPLSCEIQRNSYDQADSWSIDFDHADFPVAPQSLRACAAEIYIYDRGSLRADLASIVGTPSNPTLEPVVSGLVDNVLVEYGENGRVVTLEGQDYTALFLEHGWKTVDQISSAEEAEAAGLSKRGKKAVGHPAPVPSGRPLDELLRALIREVDATGRITLEVRVDEGTTIPVVGAAVGRTIKSGFKTSKDATYWDVMSKMARIHGFLLFVEGSKVVLAAPDSVFDRFDRLYKLRWGENLRTLRMERAMGKERVPQIEVRAYDDRTRTTLVARFPEKNQPATTGVGTKRDERQVYVLYGIRDVKVLRQFARSMYELLGRGEQVVEVETDDMRDSGDLDLLSLKAGSALLVEFNPIWDEMRNLEPPQIYGILTRKGYPANVASFLSENYRRLEALKTPLYVREARISWSNDGGVSVSGTLINFVNPGGTAS